MSKFSAEEFSQMMDYDVVSRGACIEIQFEVEGSDEYNGCWMGKMPDAEKNSLEETYWYGLVKDGSQAYSYPQKEEFLQAKIFNGKSILEIWDTIDIWPIDGCDVEERLPVLLGF